jgi:hypothetical protein
MPPHHQLMRQVKGFNRDDLLAQARRIGSATADAITLMLENSIYVGQNYKACLSMLMLSKNYSTEGLEAEDSLDVNSQRHHVHPSCFYSGRRNIEPLKVYYSFLFPFVLF